MSTAHTQMVQRAGQAVKNALNDTTLIKPDICEQCGRDYYELQAHHFLGYAKEHWLDIKWLCQPCHAIAHNKRPAIARRIPNGSSFPCPLCKSRRPTMVVDSRGTVDGTIRRRRVCGRHHRFTTYETPYQVPTSAEIDAIFRAAGVTLLEFVHRKYDEVTRRLRNNVGITKGNGKMEDAENGR